MTNTVPGLGAKFAVQPAPGILDPLLAAEVPGPCGLWSEASFVLGLAPVVTAICRGPVIVGNVRPFSLLSAALARRRMSKDSSSSITRRMSSGRRRRKASLITRFLCWSVGRCWSIEDARAEAVESPNNGASRTLAAILTWDGRYTSQRRSFRAW